jgi:hypothetical protein
MVTWARFVLSMRMVSPLGLVNRSGVSDDDATLIESKRLGVSESA